MAKFNLTLPKMGESVDEATIVSWLKNVGDQVSTDDFVVEIATDKVDSEVPTEVEGVIVEHCFKVNDVVKVGDTLCVIETTSDVEKNINEARMMETIQNERELRMHITERVTYVNGQLTGQG